MKQKLIDFYLDYVNNFLTLDALAEHYELRLPHTARLLGIGKYYHEQAVKDFSEKPKQQ